MFEGTSGPLVMPGIYKVFVSKRVNGTITPIAGSEEFSVVVEGQEKMSVPDRQALVEFQQKLARLQRAVTGSVETANALKTRLGLIKRALLDTPAAADNLMSQASNIEKHTNEILRSLRGDMVLRARNENTPPSITDRVDSIVAQQRMSTSHPTLTQMNQYAAAAAGEFAQALARLHSLIEGDLAQLEKAMEAAGAPWTPGRIPEWKDK